MIDWFTVGAQIVNFAILVVLLRLFLYKPIVKNMRRRKEDIESRLEEAEKTRRQADQKAEEYETKTRELEDERKKMLEEARRSADEERKKLVEEARNQADEKREAWVSAVEDERRNFRKTLRDTLRGEFFAALDQALEDLADASLEERMAAVLESRLKDLGDDERDRFASEVREGGDRIVVRTSRDLSKESRDRIVEALGGLLEKDADVVFEKDEDGPAGVTLATNGYRIGWTIEDYIERVEAKTKSQLDSIKHEGDEDDEDDS